MPNTNSFYRLTPGRPISASGVNQSIAEVERLSNLFAPNFQNDGGGQRIIESVVPYTVARLTANLGYGIYEWEEVYCELDAGSTPPTAIFADKPYSQMSGTLDWYPAIEISNNDDVALGTRVYLFPGSGQFFHFAHCCTEALIVPSDPPDEPACNQLYFDGTTLRLWDCGSDTWLDWCQCFVNDPGSDPPPPACVPGLCEACTEAPESWEIDVAGFEGECSAFNNVWTLVSISDCVWAAASDVSGVSVLVTLTLAAGGHTLVFQGSDQNQVLFSSTYTASGLSLPECCDPIEFARDACDCDSTNEPTDSDCAECGASTPATWTISSNDRTGPAFSGGFSRFTGAFTLTRNLDQIEDGCFWDFRAPPEKQLAIQWYINENGEGELAYTDWSQSPTVYASFITGVFGPDCCTPVEADFNFAFAPAGGNTPTSLTITPQCEGDGGGSTDCPATLTATPHCCTDEPDDEANCQCEECPNGAPPRWLFDVSFADGAFVDAAGHWELQPGLYCNWSQIRGNVEASLFYEQTLGKWLLEFTSGTHYLVMEADSAWNCCGLNRVVFRGDYSGTGILTEALLLEPNGVCDEDLPCFGDPEDPPGDPVYTDCCPGTPLPQTLYATFSGGTDTCVCLNGVTVELNYDTLLLNWHGDYSPCSSSGTFTLFFGCTLLGFGLTSNGNTHGCVAFNPALTTTNCVPLSAVFSGLGAFDCCIGSQSCTVTT